MRESYNILPPELPAEIGPSAEVAPIKFVIVYSPEAAARLKEQKQSTKRIGSIVLAFTDSQNLTNKTAGEVKFDTPDWEQLIIEMNASIPPIEGPYTQN